MTGLDWVLLAAVLVAAVGGTTQGFLAAACGFTGFAGGALLGARLGGWVGSELLPDGDADVNAPVAAVFGAILLGILLGVGLQWVGERIRRALQRPGRGAVRWLDGMLGAAFTAALVLVTAWFGSAIVLQTPGTPASWRTAVRHSTLLRELRHTLPPANDALALLARFDPLPGFAGPRAAVDAPDPAIVRVPGVKTGRAGVVRIEGVACGVGVVGTGWVVREGLVVTNQHVIAGEPDTTVIAEVGGQRVDAHAVYADPKQDIAILAAPGLAASSLRVHERPRSGTSAAILGYPEAGPFRVRAARIGTAQTVSGQDAYGAGPVRRHVLPFRGLVEQGNSGGPLVDRQGRVVGTVFASSIQAGRRRGYAVSNDVVLAALRQVDPDRRVTTGPCGH